MANKRGQLMECTERLVAARGYHGVSMQDVAKDVGVTTAAIFHHFPSKGHLVAATMTQACNGLEMALAELGEKPPLERLHAWVDLFGSIYLDRNLFCICGMLAAERDGLPEPVLQAVDTFVSFTIGWLSSVLAAHRPHDEDQEELARAILAATEGSLLMARMTGQKSHFRPSAIRMINAMANNGRAVTKKSGG